SARGIDGDGAAAAKSRIEFSRASQSGNGEVTVITTVIRPAGQIDPSLLINGNCFSLVVSIEDVKRRVAHSVETRVEAAVRLESGDSELVLAVDCGIACDDYSIVEINCNRTAARRACPWNVQSDLARAVKMCVK